MGHRRDVHGGTVCASAAGSPYRGQEPADGSTGVRSGAEDGAEDAGVFGAAGVSAAAAGAAAGFDYRHIVNATVVAHSDFKLSNRALRLAANGWELAPLVRILSGAPYNVTSGSDISLTGMGNDRPNIVGSTSFTTGKKITQSAANGNRAFFNAVAFSTSTVSTGTFGNAGRNILRGPNYYDVDSSLSRIFKVYEHLNMNVRLEAFNLFNHPFFNSFTTANPSSSSFGWANAAADPRIMQAAVKFNF